MAELISILVVTAGIVSLALLLGRAMHLQDCSEPVERHVPHQPNFRREK